MPVLCAASQAKLGPKHFGPRMLGPKVIEERDRWPLWLPVVLGTGAGLYFDGTTSARHAVTVETTPDVLRIVGSDSAMIAEWPYAELRAQSAPNDVMRLRRAGGPELARLEIRDPALIADIDARADSLDRSGTVERRLRKGRVGDPQCGNGQAQAAGDRPRPCAVAVHGVRPRGA